MVAGCHGCHGPLPETDLERYANSLRSDQLMDSAEMKESFPMYTVYAEMLLKMTKMQPHEELLQQGQLTRFDRSMGRAAFISHQWVGSGHPDPEFQQMKVLQDALRNLLSGQSEVSVDLITEAVYFRSKGISRAEWNSSPLFLWYDYFSCPQLERASANNQSPHLQKAIESIPVYVSKCHYFIALCPVLSSPDKEETFSEYTWSQRGWCCVEQTVRELTVHRGSWIMVKSSIHQELKLSPLTNASPGEHEFTVDADRAAVGGVLQKFVRRKLFACLRAGEFAHYRMLLNQQPSLFRGLPVKPIEDVMPADGFSGPEDLVERFLYQNGFRNALEYDSAGWSPLCYAAMNGEPALVKALLQKNGDCNEKTKGPRPEVNLDKGTPVLSICAKFKNHEAMQVLIHQGAMINSSAVHTPLGQACLANDPEGVRLLYAANADPHERNPFGDHALNMAAANGSVEAMDALLSLTKFDFDLSTTLHCAVLLQGGSSRTVNRLLLAKADVDQPYRQPGTSLAGILHRIKGFQYQCGKQTMFRRMGYHSRGATPLMLAIICGNFEAAATLLVEGARLDIKNSRGKTALDLIKDISGPDYLLEAMMESDMRKCISIVSNSILSSMSPEKSEKSEIFLRRLESTSSMSSTSSTSTLEI